MQAAPPAILPPNGAARLQSWHTCGGDLDPRALLFFAQLAISLVLLLFCVYLIIASTDDQWAKMTVTFIIGVWLPSPRANK
jgi:hypothetical protein